jgi:hypothetical protein
MWSVGTRELSRVRAVATALVLAAATLVVQPSTLIQAAPPPLPAGLNFGLANGPQDLSWMTASGVPWVFRYQYLAGGVNTGKGWETWNTPLGQFASYYMSASGANGYVPVFTYYELLQSSPSTGADESSRDYSNLNNAATMNAYYANFVLLMQKAQAYGRQVIVHIEPDLWGYLEQRAGPGGSPASLAAQVGSSGFADVAGIPDNAQGFAWALLKLRDKYAPGVALGIHASLWASGPDLATDTRTSVDPNQVADATATFLNASGVANNPYGSTFDLVFNDVADHDAAWYGDTSHWWDRNDVTVPNFARWLTFMTRLRADTNRPLVVWQVPVGNQYFLTMNNTAGHYQDNRAEYFLSHTAALVSAGIQAVLFGSGNANQTTYTDAMADGITNNNGVATSGFQCSACNTHVSQYADDDGGYLRVFVGRYYQPAPPPAPGAYHPMPPTRILDTRSGSPLGAGQSIDVPITGQGGVPSTGVTAVVMNVTVTRTSASSYLTVYPAGTVRPVASNLNWVAGQTVPNLVEVAVGSGGQVTAYNLAGSVDVIFDVAGYVSTTAAGPDGLFNALVPARILDTRTGTPVGSGQTFDVQVTGKGGVPGIGVSAVVLNVTVTSPSAAGYLTVFPSGTVRPVASNLNFVAGQTVPNRVIVKVGTNGMVSIFNFQGSVDVVADVGGWFVDAASNPSATGVAFNGLTPKRILDTRPPGKGPVGPGGTITVQVAAMGGVPAMTSAAPPTAVVLNVTVTDTTTASYLTVWPDGTGRPTASDLNWVAGQTVPNLVVVKLGANGMVDVYNLAGSTDVVIDVVGWYS